MTPEQWFGLAIVFTLGAMSPGPSLAVVIRNTLSGGRQQGVMTGIGHGIGFGVYAFLAAAGIAAVLAIHESTEIVLKTGGVLILIWLGLVFLNNAKKGPIKDIKESENTPHKRQGFLQGFLIALLNPKIMAWMLALYTPFIEVGTEIITLLMMGLLGMIIDGTWYVTVATLLTSGDRVKKLRSMSHIIDAAMGILMFGFAALLVSGVL